jgi:ribosome-associated toxin RatA of RatAB toxin-antitoxin module
MVTKAGGKRCPKWLKALLPVFFFACFLASTAVAADAGVWVGIPQATATGRTLHAQVLIAAPPATVWKTLTQYDNLQNYVPGYHRSRIVQSSGSSKLVDIAMSIARLLPALKYRVLVDEAPQRFTVQMQRVSGDFKELSARYQLSPRQGGNQTLLSYDLNIDPGAVPPLLNLNNVLQQNTRQTLKAFQARSEQEYREHLIGRN